MRVLQTVHSKYNDADYRFMGSSRDMLGREEYFRERGIEYEQLVPLYRDDGDVLRMLKQRDVASYDAIIFEKSDYPLTMQWVREQHPGVRVLLRSHNAEFFHRIHYELSRFDRDLFMGLSTAFEQVAFDHMLTYNRLCHDLCCGMLADAVLSITHWEAENYWPLLAGRGKVRAAPFFLPSRDVPAPGTGFDKEKLCVCLLSPAHTSLLSNAADNFFHLVGQMPADDGWSYAVTGDAEKYGFDTGTRVEVTGFLDEPMKLVSAPGASPCSRTTASGSRPRFWRA